MGLRLAPKSTIVIDLGDGDSVEARAGVSKRDFRKILEALPSDFNDDKSFNPLEADDFTVGIFNALVVSWTLKDENGNPVVATAENYLALDRESVSSLDLALFAHFNSLSLTADEKVKSGKAGGGPDKKQ